MLLLRPTRTPGPWPRPRYLSMAPCFEVQSGFARAHGWWLGRWAQSLLGSSGRGQIAIAIIAAILIARSRYVLNKP
jgi:hypothetical protein